MPLFLSVSKVGICACAVLLGCFIMAVDGTSCLDLEGESATKTLVLNVSLERCTDLCQEYNCTTYAYQPEKSRCKYFDQEKTTVGGEGWTVYPAPDCNATYLVSGSDPVEDSAITASSYYFGNAEVSHAPKWARLNTVATCADFWKPACVSVGSWVGSYPPAGEWIQVKLKQVALIKAVATRGRPQTGIDNWVSAYNVSVSNDGTNWTQVSAEGGQENFVGNTDKWNIVENDLEAPIMARFVRFDPTQWKNEIAMRFDVRGCYLATAEL